MTGTVITEKGPCQKSTCFQVQVLVTILNQIQSFLHADVVVFFQQCDVCRRQRFPPLGRICPLTALNGMHQAAEILSLLWHKKMNRREESRVGGGGWGGTSMAPSRLTKKK